MEVAADMAGREQLCFPAAWATPSPEAAARAIARRPPVEIAAPPPAAPEKRTRKCSPFPRARTVNVNKLPRRQIGDAYTLTFWDAEVEAERPRFRSQCGAGPRPCPWLLCRHHTAIVVDEETGSIKEVFPHLKILENPGEGLVKLEALRGTCSLDIVERHDDGTGGIGGLVALYQAALAGKPLGQTPGMTIDEVGKSMNLSIERIRQLGSQAMQEVRVKLRRLER